MVWIPYIMHNYYTEEDAKHLKKFKYSGTNDSWYYNTFIAPFCQWIVDNYVPSYIAPNLLTVVGFLFVLAGHLLLYFDCDSLDNP